MQQHYQSKAMSIGMEATTVCYECAGPLLACISEDRITDLSPGMQGLIYMTVACLICCGTRIQYQRSRVSMWLHILVCQWASWQLCSVILRSEVTRHQSLCHVVALWPVSHAQALTGRMGKMGLMEWNVVHDKTKLKRCPQLNMTFVFRIFWGPNCAV